MLQASHKIPALLLLTSILVSGCGAAASKGSQGTNSSSVAGSSSSITGSATLSITSIYPADSYVATVPTSVTVNFSGANIYQPSISSVTSFTITCGGNPPIAAQSISYLPGVASVSANFAAITGLPNGTVCTFQISAAVRDGAGNLVTGNHSASYTVHAVSTSGGVWIPAVVATYTSPVGSSSGQGFSGVGGNEMILQGLLVNGTQYADGIVGVWASRFSANTLVYGQSHGASAGGYTQLSCPVGYRITGIFGKAGSYIDSIGIICKTEDYTQSYRTSAAGGGGGTAYELSCPGGQFATDLQGRAGSYLNQLSLGCR